MTECLYSIEKSLVTLLAMGINFIEKYLPVQYLSVLSSTRSNFTFVPYDIYKMCSLTANAHLRVIYQILSQVAR